MANNLYVRAEVFDLAKPGSNWFKAIVEDRLIMVFYPDDGSITRDIISPTDHLLIAAVRKMETPGSCAEKANCAPLDKQSDDFKLRVRHRKENAQYQSVWQEPWTDPQLLAPSINIEVASETSAAETLEGFDEYKQRLNGTVKGKDNVEYIKAMQEKYEPKRGRCWCMYAINEIVQKARLYDSVS